LLIATGKLYFKYIHDVNKSINANHVGGTRNIQCAKG
jgi:hypothetical protein